MNKLIRDGLGRLIGSVRKGPVDTQVYGKNSQRLGWTRNDGNGTFGPNGSKLSQQSVQGLLFPEDEKER